MAVIYRCVCGKTFLSSIELSRHEWSRPSPCLGVDWRWIFRGGGE